MAAARLSRRVVLKALGWSAAGITVAAAGAASAFPALPYRGNPTREEAAGWISLRPEGHYEIWSPRAELGQGVSTALCQIAADELDAPLSKVRCVAPSSRLIAPARATVGSDSIKDYGLLMAEAAAGLATLLRRRAADRLGLPADRIRLTGDAARGPGGKAVALAALASGAPVLVDPATIGDSAARLGQPGQARRQVGRPVATDRIKTIVTADQPLYADDIRLPGMVFGTVIRSDGINGTVRNIDDSACREIPGYLGLVRDGDMVGMLAARRGALGAALAALTVDDVHDEDITSASLMDRVDVDKGLSQGALEHRPHGALVDREERFDIDLRLDVPMAAHAAMEPRTAVARFTAPDQLEIWTGTQDVFFVRDTVANKLGLSEDSVTVHGMRVGGAFGGKTICLQELEAARLARQSGRPVKVQWSRRDEFRAAFHRPPSTHRIRARLNDRGGIATWWHAFRSGHVIFTSAAMGPALQFATSFVADPGVARGATPPYAIDRLRVEFDDVRLPVKTGPWRGLAAAPNCWAIETAIDALADKAGRDPLAFRLDTIAADNARLTAVLKAAAGRAQWQRGATTPGHVLGLACGIYKNMSYAAVVADVDLSGPAPRVHRLYCAHDCGLVINPDQVRAQIEGNLVWGLGMALTEELVVDGGRILAQSHADYRVPGYADIPDMEIDLIEGAANPTGAGETAIVAAAAAITNAIARATGRRVTRLPYRG